MSTHVMSNFSYRVHLEIYLYKLTEKAVVIILPPIVLFPATHCSMVKILLLSYTC